jgi:peptidoglycan/LPS O-acetylase OafA/YrhL
VSSFELSALAQMLAVSGAARKSATTWATVTILHWQGTMNTFRGACAAGAVFSPGLWFNRIKDSLNAILRKGRVVSMGYVRLILALSVVLIHIDEKSTYFSWLGTRGGTAVQLFYIISGYLMCMVLSSGAYRSAARFYLSRALRLYPTYLIVLVLASSRIFFSNYLDSFSHLPVTAQILLALTNVTIFGQDWFFFLAPDSSGLRFTLNIWSSAPLLYTFLLVDQAWSLGVELTFYLIAPFLFRSGRVKIVILLFIASFVARLIFYIFVTSAEPWTNRFFPFELGLFLLGALAYRTRGYVARAFPVDKRLNARSVWVLVVLSLVLVQKNFEIDGLGMFFCFLLFALSLPYLLQFDSSSSASRKAGELSYPLYICHNFVISVLHVLRPHLGFAVGSNAFAVMAIILSLLLAWALFALIEAPINLRRGKLRDRPAEFLHST